jgi:hypothetical protein
LRVPKLRQVTLRLPTARSSKEVYYRKITINTSLK